MTVTAPPVHAEAPPMATAGTFVLSFDFEDWHQLVYRRIGRADWQVGSDAFPRHVDEVLALLDELAVQATFFVVGATAERHPAALARVAACGHEIACHTYDHRRAFRQTPDEFREDVARCLDVVGGICGVRPVGFRAPWFSITPESAWAHEILQDLGFRYDSSLYDSPLLRGRIRPIPAHPFRIGELWEFPIAVWKRHGLVLPLGGGSYWRALPGPVLGRALAEVARDATLPVLYFHPYEFAPEPLQVLLPPSATVAERVRETRRRVYKNARRGLIPGRLREAAARFRLVGFREALAG